MQLDKDKMAGTFGAIVLDYLGKYPCESTIKHYSVLSTGASLNQEKSHKLFGDMAKNNSAAASTVLLCLILVSASVRASECLERPACGACKEVAKQLYCLAKAKQAQSPPQEITEEEIVQIIKKTCNPEEEEEEADSTRKMDTVEQGDKLKLADRGTEGICDAECKEACKEVEGAYLKNCSFDCKLPVMEGARLVSGFLNESDPHLDGLVQFVCESVTTLCESKHSPAPEGEVGPNQDSKKAGWKPAKGFQTVKEAGKRVAAKGKEGGKKVVATVKGLFGRFGFGKPGSKENSKTDKSEL